MHVAHRASHIYDLSHHRPCLVTPEECLINRGEELVAMVIRTLLAGAVGRALPMRSCVNFSEG